MTSMAYHDDVGLIVGDNGGSVMRWDMQSGQVLATWSGGTDAMVSPNPSLPSPIQSVRCSADGATLAILTGCWNETAPSQQVHFVDSQTLEKISTVNVDSGIAVAVQSLQHGWITVDWSGTVRSIDDQSERA